MYKFLTALLGAIAVFFITPTLASAAPLGFWVSQAEISALPMSGSAWNALKAEADSSCGTPDLSDQEDPATVCYLAKSIVFARTGITSYRDGVVSAITSIVNSGTYNGRVLALGRELAAYPVAADLIDLKTFNPSLNTQFRNKLLQLRTTSTNDGPANLIECHERRPNNWGTQCGASRISVDLYLGDTTDLARAAAVFKGWLGDRTSYASFVYGDLSWQCNAGTPVGINPTGCTKSGHNIAGVLPEEMRRAGAFTWPPPKENYVWSGLEGAVVQAELLQRAGYDAWNWQDKAILRAFQWLHTPHFAGGTAYPAVGNDQWQSHLINYRYGTSFPEVTPARPGKNMGWTDWTHAGTASPTPPPPPPPPPPPSDPTPPAVSITAPTAGATVSGTAVTVSANASDNVGVTSVNFRIDGTTLAIDTTSPYSMSWNTTFATNASHTLTALARDAAGNTTISTGVAVTVCNGCTPPPPPPPPGSCLTGSTSWKNTSFTNQTGTFTVTYDSTPNTANMDGVVGLSLNAATGYASLGAITRFAPTGRIDARNGANYSAVSAVPYTQGVSYRFRLVVNRPAHTYSAYVTPAGGSEVQIANNYAFRTEQAAVASLNNWALYSQAGTHSVCNFALAAQ